MTAASSAVIRFGSTAVDGFLARPRTCAPGQEPPLLCRRSSRSTFEFTGLARLYAQGPVEWWVGRRWLSV